MRKLDTTLMHPRDQIRMIIEKVYRSGLTTTSGGNISVIDENGDVWVTPSAIDKGSLRPSDINVIPQAKNVCGPIGYATYELPGSEVLGEVIADEFVKGFNAVIMENHGTVVGGVDLGDAFQRFETLKICARTIINGSTIGTPNYLTDSEIEEFEDQIPHLLPEMESVQHPSDERAIREEIKRIVHRACTQGLMISSYGTVSVRWRNSDSSCKFNYFNTNPIFDGLQCNSPKNGCADHSRKLDIFAGCAKCCFWFALCRKRNHFEYAF